MESIQPKPETLEKSLCYHCGEDCPGEALAHDGKAFCCEGCRTVYQVLAENGLCQYYEIDKKAGISLKGRRTAEYAYLDDEEVRDKLLDFREGGQARATFHLPQIHCASCIWLLEQLHKLADGISQSRVDFPRKEIRIAYDEGKTSLRRVVELLASLGYAPAINFADLDKPQRAQAVDRSFYYKLGVAGFAFGNIMLFSFPEYLGLNKTEDANFFKIFGYLNILLALPVLLYSGRDYLQSAWWGIRQRVPNIDIPIALGMIVLFGRSTYEILSHTGAGYMDSLSGLVLFLLVGKWFQQMTFHHLSFERDYKSYFPIAVTVRRNGAESPLALSKVEVGDLLVVRHGELVPADSILEEGTGEVDYSFVTGEAQPVTKHIGDKLFAGGRQTGAAIAVRVVRKTSQSYLTQLWNDEAFQKETVASRTSQIADRIGRYFTGTILVISIITLFYWLPKDAATAFNAFTAVLIIACPCAVALSVPFTFGNLLRIMAKYGFYVKNVTTLENLLNITDVVFDKTGTLTQTGSGQLDYEGANLSMTERSALRSLARHSPHPISRQLEARFADAPLLAVTGFKEHLGKGLEGFVDKHFVQIGSSDFFGPSFFTNDHLKTTKKGTCIAIDRQLLGVFSTSTSLRPGLEGTLHGLRERGLRLSLLSGDNERERERFAALFGTEAQLFFQQKPEDKLLFIKALQKGKHKAMMVGDGLNDAGALKQSHVGVVVAEDINNFMPACDAVLDGKQFARLPDFIALAQGGKRAVYMAYGLAFIYNVVGLSYAVQGALSPLVAAVLMPLSSVSIVLLGLGMSNLLGRRIVK
jgi:Cu+-exporting ATPase